MTRVAETSHVYTVYMEPDEHEPELKFQERLYEHYCEKYGAENVEREKRFSNGRRTDFWIETGDAILAVEVENDADSVIAGSGQALLYATEHERAVPVVAVPADHIEEPERTQIASQTQVLVIEYDLGTVPLQAVNE